MIVRTVIILTVAATCYTIPIEEALKPEIKPEIPALLPENIPTKPEFIAVPVDEKAPLKQPALIAVPVDDEDPKSKDDSDLKTDNSLWWSSYYKYLIQYRNYYNEYVPIPRIRTYNYYEPRTYIYWRSYW